MNHLAFKILKTIYATLRFDDQSYMAKETHGLLCNLKEIISELHNI